MTCTRRSLRRGVRCGDCARPGTSAPVVRAAQYRMHGQVYLVDDRSETGSAPLFARLPWQSHRNRPSCCSGSDEAKPERGERDLRTLREDSTRVQSGAVRSLSSAETPAARSVPSCPRVCSNHRCGAWQEGGARRWSGYVHESLLDTITQTGSLVRTGDSRAHRGRRTVS